MAVVNEGDMIYLPDVLVSKKEAPKPITPDVEAVTDQGNADYNADGQDEDLGIIPHDADPSTTGDTAHVMLGGIVKAFTSGIPQLYGLAGAIMDASSVGHGGGKEHSLSQGLFKEGGLEALQDDVRSYAQDYQEQNPDATAADIAEQVDNYRATPDFYMKQADAMRPGIAQGMKNAMVINQGTGLNKTPDQEGFLDQAREVIASALIPLPGASLIPKFAANITERVAGNIAGNVASKTVGGMVGAVLPGTANYSVGSVAANAGIGTAIAGATSLASGSSAQARTKPQAPPPDTTVLQPGMANPFTGQPITAPITLGELRQQNAGANPQPLPSSPQPSVPGPVRTPGQSQPILGKPPQISATPNEVVPTIQPPLPSNSKVALPNTINQPQTFAGATPGVAGLVGGALGTLALGAAALKGGRLARSAIQRVRGQTPVNVDAFAGLATGSGPIRAAVPRGEKIAQSTAIRGNLNRPESAPTLPGRVLARFDKAFNKDAPLEKQARETGGGPLEALIQSQLGTKLSVGAKSADKARLMHSGMLPDGSHARIVPQAFFDAGAAATQDQRDAFTRLIQGLNIQTRRNASYNSLLNEQQVLATARRTPQNQTRMAEVRRLMQLRNGDDPSSRITFSQVPDSTIRQQISQARADPTVRALESMYRTISHDLINAEYNAGLHTAEETHNLAQNNHYSPLFEFEYKRKNNTAANVDLHDTTMPDAAPERAIDPFSAMAFKIANAVDNSNRNIATTRIINAFRANDPTGQVVREVDRAGNPGVVSVLVNGVEQHYQFARPSVAESLKSEAIDVGPILGAANHLRSVYQNLVTGPLAGTLYTPLRSVIFDAFATQATRRPDRPFGLVGYAAARAAGNSPRARRIADLISAVDPTGPLLVTPYGFGNAALMHMYDSAAQHIERMATTQSPVFRALANIPGGQTTLTAMGARMAHAYDSSVVHLMEQNNGVHVHQMVRDTLSVRNELEGFMRQYQNAGRSDTAIGRAAIDPTVRTIQTLYHGYSGLLNTIHNASRYGFAAQAYSLLQHRAASQGRAVTEAEIRTLAEEVRRSAGDLAGQPGSKLLKGFEVAVPYSNISFQSARHVMKAIARDPMQVGLTMMGLSGGLYATYKTIQSRGPEAENWYWNHANPWERVGAIRAIPKPDTLLYMAQNGGHLPPWNPNDPMGEFYDIAVSPELLPYITMVMAGYEHMGIMPRPNDATSITKDELFSLADSLAVGTNPAVNIPMIAFTGNSVNLTAGGSGRSVMQGPAVARGTGANADKTLSGIPAVIPQLMTATMGLAGTGIYNMADQGVQAYHDGQNFSQIAQRIGLEGEEFLKERPAVPDIPFIYNAPAKVYRSTPASRRMQELSEQARGALGKGRGIDAAWSMEYGKAASGPLSATSPHVMDQQVLNMLSDVHNTYMRGSDLTDAMKEAANLKKLANQYQQSKVKTPVDDIQSGKFRHGLQDLLLQWQTKEDQALSHAETFDKYLADTYGDRFTKEKVPPTIEGVAALVHRYARPLNPGEVPLSQQVPQQKPLN